MGIVANAAAVLAGVGVLYILRKWREWKWESSLTCKRIDGQVVVITGATSGLGKVTAEALVARGAIVVLACRDVAAAKQIIAEFKVKNPVAVMDAVELDLSSLESVKKCASILLERFPHINILINNAGVSIPAKMGMKTKEGYEINFGINHLGHFLLTYLLLHRLKKSTPSRIVVVSSKLHEQGTIDWDALEGTKNFEDLGRRTGPNAAYCTSKLANVLFAMRLSEKLANLGVNVYTVCPGWNFTRLFRYSSVPIYSWIVVFPVAFWFMKPARIGAQTIVHCAVSEEVENESGLFYRDCKVYNSQANLSPNLAFKLWELSCKLCHIEW